MRLLCLADIDGDAGKLGAVLASAERFGYDRIVVAGNICFPGPSPLETWRRLAMAGALCVQGVADRALTSLDAEAYRPRTKRQAAHIDRLHSTRKELGEVILRRMAQLPTMTHVASGGEHRIVLVHGSPTDPGDPITPEMTDIQVAERLGKIQADVVICGGSRRVFARKVNGMLVLGAGSVGESPCGSYARAVLLELGPRPKAVVRPLAVPVRVAA